MVADMLTQRLGMSKRSAAPTRDRERPRRVFRGARYGRQWRDGFAAGSIQRYVSTSPSRARPPWLRAFLVVVGTSAAAGAQSEDDIGSPHPSWQWLLMQLLPSPELVVQDGRVAFGSRWQLTPVLYSFGIHRSQSPWRTFVVEPIVRHSGSLELHVTPEYIALASAWSDRFGLRSGLRSYVPVIERGDYLSLSFGTSVLRYQQETSVAYELGAHVLFGFVGTILSYSPTPEGGRFISTLQLRFF